MIYEQLLQSKGTHVAKIKRAFQIIGMLHFLLAFLFLIFALAIYWKLLFVPLIFLVAGLIWGSASYLFTSDYKYLYVDGVFSAYKLNCYGKYVLTFSANVVDMKKTSKRSSVKLTNRTCTARYEFNDKVYGFTPDDYMLSILDNGVKDYE